MGNNNFTSLFSITLFDLGGSGLLGASQLIQVETGYMSMSVVILTVALVMRPCVKSRC